MTERQLVGVKKADYPEQFPIETNFYQMDGTSLKNIFNPASLKR